MRRSLWTISLSLLGLGLLGLPAQAASKAPPTSVLQSQATASSFDATDCITCHEPALAKMKATKHFGLEQSCATCHDRDKSMIHSKDQADGKATPGPAVKDLKPNEINATCLDCHEKGNQQNWMGGKHDARKVACTCLLYTSPSPRD